MITEKDIIEIHYKMIERTGGLHGLRDEGMLNSAVHSIYQTFNGRELYPTIVEKASRLCFLLSMNHPFYDGNKRISMHILALFLRLHDFEYQPSIRDVIRVGFAIANHELDYVSLLQWVREQIENMK